MNVLIIGGTGLISTGITRQLVERGDKVTLYNRGRRPAEFGAGVTHLVGDRTAYAAFEAQIAQAGPFDAVIDMIAFKPEDVQSAIRAFRGGTGQYVFCSTIDVYTKPAAHYPIREDAERRPSSAFPYALNKALCEAILFDAHTRGDLVITSIRPAYTYGEGSSILHTLGWDPYFLVRLRQGKPVIVHGDGTSFWAPCHRDDVAHAFVGAAGNPKAFGRGYHATSKEWLTWNAYVQTVAEAIGAPPPKMVHIPTEVLARVLPKAAEWCAINFSFNNVFDNSAACDDLGFRYTIAFAEGVRRVVSWLEAHGRLDQAQEPAFYERVILTWERLGAQMVQQLVGLDA